VEVRSKGEQEGLERIKSQIVEELNVKQVDITVTPPPATAVVEAAGPVVKIDTKITPELADEGRARELVHRLQTMRKRAGFDIADYISTYYQGGSSIQRVIQEFAPYIKQETLSRDLIQGPAPHGAYAESHKVDGDEVVLGVKWLQPPSP